MESPLPKFARQLGRFARRLLSPDARGVLAISHDAAMAGSQILLLNLLKEWKRRAPFPVKVICVQDGEMRPQFEALFPTLFLSDFTSPAERKAALAAFTQETFRVIYSSTIVNGPLLEELRPFGIPIITHSHELQKAIERWAPGGIMAATLRNTDFFLGGASAVTANLIERHWVSPGDIDIVYDFIEPWDDPQTPTPADRLSLRAEVGIVEGDIVVFGCGTTDWRKGPDLFLKTALLACRQEPSLKFVWIGGEPSYGKEEISSQGLDGRIRFIGNRASSRRYYYTGHLFALTSREDPCPLVALEAADAGLPVVCFEKSGDIPKVIGPDGGAVVPFEDTQAAADAIVSLARNRAARAHAGRVARNRVRSGHTSKAAAVAIESVIARVLKRDRPKDADRPRPIVSVIVPNYQHEKYLPERLRSVAEQSLSDIEIILLDDASRDGSRSILEDFARKDPRARLILNPSNSGSTFKQWRKGMREARGRHVWIAESDDTCDREFLATLVARLEAEPAAILACSQLRMTDPSGTLGGTPDEWLDELDPVRWKSDFSNDGADEIRRFLCRKNTILNASGVVFRNFPGVDRLVDDSMRLCADWLFWIRLLARGRICYTSAPLNHWRLTTSNARTRPPGELEWEEGQRILNEAADTLELDRDSRATLLENFHARCRSWGLAVAAPP
jgi:glycosyltransferase involved in cell wall biosynthesis